MLFYQATSQIHAWFLISDTVEDTIMVPLKMPMF